MPAHAGVDQCVRGNEANFNIRCIERYVFGFQAQTVATGFQQWAQDLGANGSIRHLQHLGVCVR